MSGYLPHDPDEDYLDLPPMRSVVTVELPDLPAERKAKGPTVDVCGRAWRVNESRAGSSYRQHRCGLPADGHTWGGCVCRYCGAPWEFGGSHA